MISQLKFPHGSNRKDAFYENTHAGMLSSPKDFGGSQSGGLRARKRSSMRRRRASAGSKQSFSSRFLFIASLSSSKRLHPVFFDLEAASKLLSE